MACECVVNAPSGVTAEKVGDSGADACGDSGFSGCGSNAVGVNSRMLAVRMPGCQDARMPVAMMPAATPPVAPPLAESLKHFMGEPFLTLPKH